VVCEARIAVAAQAGKGKLVKLGFAFSELVQHARSDDLRWHQLVSWLPLYQLSFPAPRCVVTPHCEAHGNSGGPLLDMSDHVVGVITLGANPGLAQNLNFAVPCNEVQALLITARQQAKPLDSVASNSDDSFAKGTVWTSIMSGHDFNLRQDGDYLYIDLVSLPPIDSRII
jgi:hypothetical protein